MFAFDRDKGPTQNHQDTLEERIDKGYMCGESLDVPPAYNLKEAHHCNDPVEPIYYATQEVDELLQWTYYVLCAMDTTLWWYIWNFLNHDSQKEGNHYQSTGTALIQA
jgi:hypothetical protein